MLVDLRVARASRVPRSAKPRRPLLMGSTKGSFLDIDIDQIRSKKLLGATLVSQLGLAY